MVGSKSLPERLEWRLESLGVIGRPNTPKAGVPTAGIG